MPRSCPLTARGNVSPAPLARLVSKQARSHQLGQIRLVLNRIVEHRLVNPRSSWSGRYLSNLRRSLASDPLSGSCTALRCNAHRFRPRVASFAHRSGNVSPRCLFERRVRRIRNLKVEGPQGRIGKEIQPRYALGLLGYASAARNGTLWQRTEQQKANVSRPKTFSCHLRFL